MMDHKVCPHCGQPAVLQMDRCRRCGYVYPTPGVEPTVTFTRPLSAASIRELERARGPAPRSAAPWLLAALALAACAAAVLVIPHLRAPVPAAPLAAGAGRSLPSAPFRDPTAGLFVERKSRFEMPVLTISNADSDGMHLFLKDSTGKVLHLSIDSMATRSTPVPAGRYDVAISSDNPAIRPNYGDAVFRSFKEYSATFVQSPFNNPIHLGD